MKKFGGLFARKATIAQNGADDMPRGAMTPLVPAAATASAALSAQPASALPHNPLEIDEELFCAVERGDGEAEALRENYRRLEENLATADERIIALESERDDARRRLRLAEDEKCEQCASLEQAGAEQARLSGKLAETEARLEAAQERVGAIEKVLGKAREHLLARAEKIRDCERRLNAMENERDALQARIAECEAESMQRDAALREAREAQATLMERSGALARAFTEKEAALERAAQALDALNERLAAAEAARAAERQLAERAIEQLSAALRREKTERAATDRALETARDDFARLAREVMALERSQTAKEPRLQPLAANAA